MSELRHEPKASASVRRKRQVKIARIEAKEVKDSVSTPS
jgi:hypothetical protein